MSNLAAGSLKTAKFQVLNRLSVREWSNGHDLIYIHGSSLLLKDLSKKIRSISVKKIIIQN